MSATCIERPLSALRTPNWEDYRHLLAPYRQPKLACSLWQLANTLAPYVTLWVLMWLSLSWSYWLTLLLAIPTAGLLVRTFVIQHDCGHRSFFRSKKANDAVGYLLSMLTWAPYHTWRKAHAVHHATSGDMDRRGMGDIKTLTVTEYLRLNSFARLRYRLYRNPLILFGIGGALYFVILQRLTLGLPKSWTRERACVYGTNVALALIYFGIGWLIGFWQLMLIQLPVIAFASSAGIWLFYVQHQYEDTYWQPGVHWDYARAGIEGSSHYDLPKVIQWFTANIGIHQIHHLDSKIPNYRLQQCLDDNPEFRQATRLTFWSSLACARLKLWDEEQGRLVGFDVLKARRRSADRLHAAHRLPHEETHLTRG